MLEQGLVQSQADLARRLGVSRAKITQTLNLLKLDTEILYPTRRRRGLGRWRNLAGEVLRRIH